MIINCTKYYSRSEFNRIYNQNHQLQDTPYTKPLINIPEYKENLRYTYIQTQKKITTTLEELLTIPYTEEIFTIQESNILNNSIDNLIEEKRYQNIITELEPQCTTSIVVSTASGSDVNNIYNLIPRLKELDDLIFNIRNTLNILENNINNHYKTTNKVNIHHGYGVFDN